MRIFSFRNIRIILLLAILASVALYTKDQRLVTQGWYRPIDVAIYPINADDHPATDQYINNLNLKNFTAIEKFFQQEGKRYGIIADTPVIIHLAAKLDQLPPAVPESGGSVLKNVFWSLKLRWWAYKNAKIPDGLDGAYTIRAFLLLHEPANNSSLRHSVGIQKGLMAIVHAYADSVYTKQNNIILTHELLHTFGATDKYSSITHLPIYPEGFAQPEKNPLYPQKLAEIMAVKRAISKNHVEIPKSLKYEMVNEFTAREIGWLDDTSAR